MFPPTATRALLHCLQLSSAWSLHQGGFGAAWWWLQGDKDTRERTVEQPTQHQHPLQPALLLAVCVTA